MCKCEATNYKIVTSYHAAALILVEDIQINRRTKAKYTLRFPRFKAIRWDLSPSDADSLKDVEEMYNHKINKQRVSQRVNPSFITY